MNPENDSKDTVRAGKDCLVELTPQSDDNWGLHINNSTYVTTFSDVTRQVSGGLHCWSDGSVVLYVDENDSNVPEAIREKLVEIAERN